jgi:hypothetical protein
MYPPALKSYSDKIGEAVLQVTNKIMLSADGSKFQDSYSSTGSVAKR